MAEDTLIAPSPEAQPTAITEIDKSLLKASERRNKSKAAEQPATPVATTEPPEVKVETPSTPAAKVKTETKAEEKKEAKPKKEKFWAKKEPATPATTETKADLKVVPTTETKTLELPKEIQEELARSRALLSKQSVKAVLKAEESGKDFLTFYKEMASRDPFNMPYDKLYDMMLDEEQYTPAEKERKAVSFADKTEDDQADIISRYRKELKAKQDKELTDYTPKYETPQDTPDPTQNFFAELEPIAKTFENKELYGVTVTPEIAKNILDPNKPLIRVDEKGNLDKEDYFRVKFIIDNFSLIAQTIEDQVTGEITEKYEGMIVQPLPSTNGTSVPQTRQQATETQKRIDNFKSSLPQSTKAETAKV